MKMPPMDITGQRYGRLVAVEITSTKTAGKTHWLFRCDCGSEVETTTNRVRSGIAKSCGCLRSDRCRERATHGHTREGRITHEYHCWAGAKARCTNPEHISFPEYGAVGITMCDEWISSFAAFFQHMGPCPDGMTLDRIDNDKGYVPGNCRWATGAQQARNKRDSVKVVHNGVGMNLKDYADALGLNYGSLKAIRHRYGYTPEEAAEHLLASPKTRTRPTM